MICFARWSRSFLENSPPRSSRSLRPKMCIRDSPYACRSCSPRPRRRLLRRQAGDWGCRSAGPVSYTHLDVYKRQVESSAAKKAGVHSGNGIIDHRRDQHMIGRIHDRKHSFRKGSASRRIWGRFRRIRPAKHSIAQPNANCSAFRKIHKLSTGSRQFFHHIALFLRKLNFFILNF